jgi:hypothetical protein
VNHGEYEFDPLEAAIGALRGWMGACPNAAALAGYAADSLPPVEAARMRAHVSACGICDSLVEGLRNFDDPAVDTSPGWAARERRLRARVFPKPRWRRWAMHPAVAYGVALAAVMVAVIPVRRPALPTAVAPGPIAAPGPTVAPGTIEMQSLRVIDLNTLRGGGVVPFTLDSRDRWVLLSFLIDIRPGFHYQASLDGRTAQAVVSSDGKGNFAVLVNRDLLGPGAHRLTVAEINPASGKVERPFDFPFQL